MACQLLPSHNNTSVLKRRGCSLPVISVTPQDFYVKYNDEGNEDINKALLMKNILQYLTSPRKIPDDMNGRMAKPQVIKSSSKVCPTPVITDIPSRFVAEGEFEQYLTDIKLEDIINNDNASTDNQISESFLTHLSNSKSRVTLFKNESDNFFENYDFDNKDTTLLLPKSIDLITPGTPVIVKRSIKDNQDEFDIYFPDIFTPNLVQRGLYENGSFFRFPDTPPSDTILDENKENSYNFEAPLNQQVQDFNQVPSRKLFAAPDEVVSFSSTSLEEEFNGIDVYMEDLTTSIGNDNKSATKTKRNQNELERKRRVEQHQRFQNLRTSIPRIAEKRKMAKINILQAAISYIGQLHEEDTMLEQTIAIEKRRNDFLIRKLAFLSKGA